MTRTRRNACGYEVYVAPTGAVHLAVHLHVGGNNRDRSWMLTPAQAGAMAANAEVTLAGTERKLLFFELGAGHFDGRHSFELREFCSIGEEDIVDTLAFSVADGLALAGELENACQVGMKLRKPGVS